MPRLASSITLVLGVTILLGQDTAGQTTDVAMARERALATTLEAITAGEWHRGENDPAWLELRRELNVELTQRPNGPLAALARRTTARVGLQMLSLIAAPNDQLSVEVSARPRFLLDVPVPYVADISVSIDGGEWTGFVTLRDGDQCGIQLGKGGVWPVAFAEGFHRIELAADISYLRALPLTREKLDCGSVKYDKADGSARAVENAFEREHRVLPAMSFAISRNLLGATLVTAAAIEASLPAIPVRQWMIATVASAFGPTIGRIETWMPEFCNPEEGFVFVGNGGFSAKPRDDARHQVRALCATLHTGFPNDDRIVTLRLRLGTVNEALGDWSIEPPTLQDLSIGTSMRVMDVPFLSMLPSLVAVPADRLPGLNVSILPWDIHYEPRSARPGDPITITATIRNTGERDAPYITGLLGLQSCCADVVFKDFLVDIPVQGSVVVSMMAKMPQSGAIAVNIMVRPANADMHQGAYMRIFDVNPDDNEAVLDIGCASSRPCR